MEDLLERQVPKPVGLLWSCGRLLIAVSLVTATLGCSKDENTTNRMAEDRARNSEQIAGGSYAEFDERRDSYEGSRGRFEGFDCTEDCSGHEAGFAWAEENGMADPDDCGGNSWSFIEGCQAYAEQNSEEGE